MSTKIMFGHEQDAALHSSHLGPENRTRHVSLARRGRLHPRLEPLRVVRALEPPAPHPDARQYRHHHYPQGRHHYDYEQLEQGEGVIRQRQV